MFPHIETSHLICSVNKLTGIYMGGTFSINGLNKMFVRQFREKLSAFRSLHHFE